MKTLRSRLILSHLIPVMLVTPLVSAAMLYIIQTQVIVSSVRAELVSQARLLAQLAYSDPTVWIDPQQAGLFIDNLSPFLTSQVMLLTPDGLVLASSEQTGSSSLDTLITVQEFRQVQEGRIVVHTLSEEGKVDELADIFVPVLAQDGKLLGILRQTNEMTGLDSRFAQARRMVIWVLLGGLALGVLLGLILALQIGKPLREVTQAVSSLARGERQEPLPETGLLEIRQLEASFNSLVTRLHALEASRRKLLANLVHELARPLGALRSAILALKTGAVEEVPLRSELLDGMDETATRLQRLLDELAQHHDQLLGALELSIREVSLEEWLPPLLAPYRQSAIARNLDWSLQIEPALPLVNIDPDRIAQALQNLASNAIQYTNPGGKVSIAVFLKDNATHITVHDNGPGIPLSEQEEIWKPFYRGHSQGRFPQGMGLGLGIAREIVQAHGGTIHLESNVTQGSTFTVVLPLRGEN